MAKTKGFSLAGRSHSGRGTLGRPGGAPDRRKDIEKSFVDELGFAEVRGTNRIPTATLNSYAIALKGLEHEYGAIAASEHPVFVTGARGNTLAAVVHKIDNPADQFMVINGGVLGSTRTNLQRQANSEASGWNTKTNGKITKRNAYTVTHEYGHMLHNAIVAKRGITHEQASREIETIAKTKYNANGQVSRYGSKNSAEFFAESFASLHSGSPNAYGKAMGDWLKKNSLK